MRPGVTGLLAMLTAGAVWGLSPLYWSQLNAVPPLEVLAHRTLWSLAVFLVLIAATGQGAALRAAWGARWRLLLSALAVSANWFGYILAIHIGRATESSLGYYMFPLLAGATGWLILGERFGRAQAAGFALATLAVALLTWRVGAPPWLALFLAVTFTLYGFLKRDLRTGPLVSLTAEMLWLAPPALIWIAGAEAFGWGGAGAGALGRSPDLLPLLAVSGLITGLPLVLFAYAARRLTYATLGLAQYLNPTLQFFCAILVFGETFTPVHAAAFGLIWCGVGLYAWGAIAAERRAPSRESAVLASGTTS